MSDDESAVGLLGGPDVTADVRDHLAAAGISVVDDVQAIRSANPEAIVAVGERAVADAAGADLNSPVVPVAAGAGIRSVPETAINTLADGIERESWTIEHHVPLSIEVEDDVVGTAVFDVSLVTAEAAHISEYSVTVDGDALDRSRADGVVLATPAGSTEYARRIDGPVLSPGTGFVVAWIAPFRSNPDRWVVDPQTLSLTVEREESTVDLLVDERHVRTVAPEETVTVSVAAPMAVAVLEANQDRFSP